MRKIWFGLLVAMVGLILAGTSSTAVADQSSAGADAQQKQEIQARFEKTPNLKNDHIEVTVDDGIAVLEGTVDSKREKKEAQQLAHVDGILGVNNRLEVHGTGK